jgi:hypothetical protein
VSQDFEIFSVGILPWLTLLGHVRLKFRFDIEFFLFLRLGVASLLSELISASCSCFRSSDRESVPGSEFIKKVEPSKVLPNAV